MKTKKIKVTVPDLDSLPLVNSFKTGLSAFADAYKAQRTALVKERTEKKKQSAKTAKTTS